MSTELTEPHPSSIATRAQIIAVVIPSYKVTRHICDVIERIGPECALIYVVDDKCPDGSGELVLNQCRDPRVRVVRHQENQGVGGAVMTGYLAAIGDGAEILVKIDGDGQMAPELIGRFVQPIQAGLADYTKGNRFYDLDKVRSMPGLRLFGNTALSFLAKFSTGYWDIFDPTNGYTAIHARVASHLPHSRISRRYFFESDVLFRLNTLRAVVVDIPMFASYGDEVSNLKISRIFGEFLWKHARNFGKRIFYNYFLRDLSAASLQLLIGAALLVFGLIYGISEWHSAANNGSTTAPGTVMLAAMPVLLGIQLLLAFLTYDIQTTPKSPIHPRLSDQDAPPTQSHALEKDK